MTATAPSALATIKAQPLEPAKDLWITLTFALKTDSTKKVVPRPKLV
jgi:hypothetical protein